MEHIIQIVCRATGETDSLSGQYVWGYDTQSEDGQGYGNLETTPLKEHAKRFPSFEEAIKFWQQQSQSVPVRPDGKPNRPLTAWTVAILGAP